jgi:hypothetical protein
LHCCRRRREPSPIRSGGSRDQRGRLSGRWRGRRCSPPSPRRAEPELLAPNLTARGRTRRSPVQQKLRSAKASPQRIGILFIFFHDLKKINEAPNDCRKYTIDVIPHGGRVANVIRYGVLRHVCIIFSLMTKISQAKTF